MNEKKKKEDRRKTVNSEEDKWSIKTRPSCRKFYCNSPEFRSGSKMKLKEDEGWRSLRSDDITTT